MPRVGTSPSEGMDAADMHVAYSGSLQLPFCVGSAAIPLFGGTAGGTASSQQLPPHSSSPSVATTAGAPHCTTSEAPVVNRKGNQAGKRAAPAIAPSRCTHRRYCYLRDGSELSEDCFYRWLLHHHRNNTHHSSSDTNIDAAGTDHHIDKVKSRASHKRRRLDPAAASPSPSTSLAIPSTTPSPFYAFVDCVEFLVPSSFAQPRRIVHSPPFIIADDTWAEHPVEIRVHFLPRLGIPPVMILHQVLLQQRVTGIPLGLLNRTHGLPKPEPMVIISAGGSGSGNSDHVTSTDAKVHENHSIFDEEEWCALCAAVTVSERQDALRILHPSFDVVRHFRSVLQRGDDTHIDTLREHFLRHILGMATDHPSVRPSESDSKGVAEGLVDHSRLRGRPPVVATHKPALKVAQLPRLYQREAARTARAAGVTTGASQGSTHSEDENQNNSNSEDGFLLPAEACIYDHVQHRHTRCLAALRGALADLEDEQSELCDGIVRTLRALQETADALHRSVDSLHNACLVKHAAGSKGRGLRSPSSFSGE